ncbi:Uncharacterised protein [Vibrio cholerae]|nr:Uncharacterised protein [Vibrio cholerae]
MDDLVILRQVKIDAFRAEFIAVIQHRGVEAVDAGNHFVFFAIKLVIDFNAVGLIKHIDVETFLGIFKEELHQTFTGKTIHHRWQWVILIAIEHQ